MQALLGLQPDALNDRIILRPTLPHDVNMLRVSNMRVGMHRISFEVRQENDTLKVDVTRADPVAVVVEAPIEETPFEWPAPLGRLRV
jgi:hypothetical protein